MTDSNERSRRRFLKATGAAGVTAAVAGCTGGGGGGGDGGDGEPTATETDMADTPMATATPTEGPDETPTQTTPEPAINYDKYPYGIGETRIEDAKRVMEEAGYGPDNRYDLRWLQYQSQTYKSMANQIRSRLDAAHINMSISSAKFGPLINQARKGNVDAFTLGWIADYPAPDNFLQLVDPPRTNYSKEGATGAYLYWTEDSNHQTDPNARQFAIEQFNRVENNPAPTEEQTQIRNDAYVKMEEAVWADLPLINLFHGSSEPMWYDDVDYQPAGAMGGSRSKENNVSIEGNDTLNLINSTITTFDPIRSTDTAGGTVIMNVFDALTNYPNGQTNVETLLAEGFELSDDATTYTFNLKSDVTFHNGDDLTAQDFVYSFRRLVESSNSRRSSFATEFLGITRETTTDEGGNTVTVPNTLGVTAVDDTTLEIEIEKPFASSLAILAYSAFSAIPEGIVGDIEGYDGEMEYQQFATSNPIGCGPFQFENWEQRSEVNVTRFDDYHGQVASVNTLNWAIIENSNASYNYFINENADVGGVPTQQFDPEKVTIDRTDDRGRKLGTYGPLKNGKTVNYAKVPEVSTFYVGFNCRNVPLAVRRAMAYVINRPQFNKNIFKERSVPAYHLTPPQIFPGGASAYNEHYQG